MKYWVVKTEPSAYNFAELLAEGSTSWDGVKNAQAQIHLRAMRSGDRVMVYHTGREKSLVGLARVQGDPTPDPGDPSGKRVAVTLKAGRPLRRPVPLAEIKAEPDLADLALVRHGRLSVLPCSPAEWKRLLGLEDRR